MTVKEITKNGQEIAEAIPETTQAPIRISDADLLYHKRVVQQNAAIPGIREQINGLQQTLAGIDGASRSWLAHLTETYGLQDGDQVTADGEIVRTNGEK